MFLLCTNKQYTNNHTFQQDQPPSTPMVVASRIPFCPHLVWTWENKKERDSRIFVIQTALLSSHSKYAEVVTSKKTPLRSHIPKNYLVISPSFILVNKKAGQHESRQIDIALPVPLQGVHVTQRHKDKKSIAHLKNFLFIYHTFFSRKIRFGHFDVGIR